jgi:hypothetical protein
VDPIKVGAAQLVLIDGKEGKPAATVGRHRDGRRELVGDPGRPLIEAGQVNY